MVKPEHRIESRVIKLRHMAHVTSNGNMDGIVEILDTGKCTRAVLLPYMITEGCKVLVVRIIHQDIDVALQALELRFHCCEDLVILRGGIGLDS